jgi:hypothetical protein
MAFSSSTSYTYMALPLTSRACHARFMKYFFCHLPFGKKEAYSKAVIEADLTRLVRLIKVCGFLMQTKVYLFWNARSITKAERSLRKIFLSNGD